MAQVGNGSFIGNNLGYMSPHTAFKVKYIIENSIIKLFPFIDPRRSMTILGETKKKILLQLAEQPLHGYQIALKIGVSVTGIYQHLKELRDEGFIIIINKNRRKIYALTEKGNKLIEVIQME